MKKLTKRVVAIMLSTMLVLSTIAFAPMSALAANYSTSYTSYATPSNSGDYAYWNGSKVVRASGTTVSEVKWMQASINYCIKYKGLKASYLDVDGSFGPASKSATIAFQKAYGLSADGSFGPSTIAKMKSVLSSPNPTPAPTSKVTTSQIQSVLNKYNYVTGRYWTYKSGGSATKSYVSTTRKGRSYSYKYNGVECYGFANFVMHEVTGKDVNPNNGNKNGWKYIAAKDVSDLRVGDIVRIGKSNSDGHSGVVLTVNSSGTCTFAQCFGGVDNKISIGTSLASTRYGTHSSLKSMKNNGVLLYVYRYVG